MEIEGVTRVDIPLISRLKIDASHKNAQQGRLWTDRLRAMAGALRMPLKGTNTDRFFEVSRVYHDDLAKPSMRSCSSSFLCSTTISKLQRTVLDSSLLSSPWTMKERVSRYRHGRIWCRVEG